MSDSSQKLCGYDKDDPAKINYGGVHQTRETPVAAPLDKYHMMKITMYFFGITCLLPWYFFIQANEYWMYKLRNVSADASESEAPQTNLQVTFPTYLAISSKVPYVLFLFVNSAIAHRYRPENRMLYPFIIMVALFIAIIVMVPINTDDHQYTFFAITICIIVVINVACAFVQGGGTGIAGTFPKVFMGYYVNGMALGGILASVVQILSITIGSSAISSAFIYFISAAVILCITILIFSIAVRTEFYKFYMSKQASAKHGQNVQIQEAQQAKANISHVEIFKKIWVYAVSVIILFWVSLSMIPGVVSLVTSTSTAKSIWTGRLFLPVACFFMFNMSDLGGRILATVLQIPPNYRYATLTLSISRAIFIPLVMLCNAHPRTHLPIIFDNDESFIMIIFFFAFTNGYLCNIVLSQAPKTVPEEHQELAGTQMAFFLGLGLMLGSVSSYGFVKLL